jgi:hypothetical protein
MKIDDWVIIVQIGGEGGDLKLYGCQTPNGWEYTREIFDHSAAMLDEPLVHHRSHVVSSIEEGLHLLDRYPWHRLYPIKVHPYFAGAVMSAVRTRILNEGGNALRDLDRWEQVCSQDIKAHELAAQLKAER